MSKQVKTYQPTDHGYPVAIGQELWLLFILILEAYPKTGSLAVSFNQLHKLSSIPKTELPKALANLKRFGYLRVKRISSSLYRIKLSHYHSRINRLPKGKLYLKEERLRLNKTLK